MSESKDPQNDLDKLLTGMNFGKMMDVSESLTSQKDKHRAEMASMLTRFLEVVDSIEALVNHCEQLSASGQQHVPYGSANTTLRQALQVLSQLGVEPMQAVGQPLNLAFHDVDQLIVDPSVEEDTVLEEKTRGYLWNGLLLRRAKVVISRLA